MTAPHLRRVPELSDSHDLAYHSKTVVLVLGPRRLALVPPNCSSAARIVSPRLCQSLEIDDVSGRELHLRRALQAGQNKRQSRELPAHSGAAAVLSCKPGGWACMAAYVLILVLQGCVVRRSVLVPAFRTAPFPLRGATASIVRFSGVQCPVASTSGAHGRCLTQRPELSLTLTLTLTLTMTRSAALCG